MAEKIGLDAKLYRLTTGSRATWGAADANGMNAGAAPSNLSEIESVRDVSLNLTKGSAEVLKRGISWALNVVGVKRASITVSCPYDETDEGYLALMAAWLNNTTIPLAVLSGDKATVGVQGLWADFHVSAANKGEVIEDVQTMEFTIMPGVSDVDPEWIVVTA